MSRNNLQNTQDHNKKTKVIQEKFSENIKN